MAGVLLLPWCVDEELRADAREPNQQADPMEYVRNDLQATPCVQTTTRGKGCACVRMCVRAYACVRVRVRVWGDGKRWEARVFDFIYVSSMLRCANNVHMTFIYISAHCIRLRCGAVGCMERGEDRVPLH